MSALAIQPQLALDKSDLPALIVLGRDDAAKAHASWFDQTEADQARAAAKTMGMMALTVGNDEVRGLADLLPHGKIFGSGKAFVPFVKGALYDQLVAHVPVAEQIRPLRLIRSQADAEHASAPPAPINKPGKAPPLTVPTDWSNIVPGSVVLATEGDEGWFEAVVVEVQTGDSVWLQWRDYADQPKFVRSLKRLALLHPSASAT